MLLSDGKSIVKNCVESPFKFCKKNVFLKFETYTTQHQVQSTTESMCTDMDTVLV